MARRIVIIQGHPDPAGKHLCHALADAYAQGAEEAGHEVQRINIAELEFPWLRTKEAFESAPLPLVLRPCQEAIGRADHLVMVYPLWLGTMPALMKAFLEQVFRPGFAFKVAERGKMWTKRLKGKTARIIVTMGMPALVYRWYFGAHSLKSLERNILGFSGIGPIKESLFGMVEGVRDAKRQNWLTNMRSLGSLAR
jgi:putative NADPH-quinone reductase